jgi:4-diphosphocytidyl-2-C-methyl-D-erythritol kinase
MSAPRSTITETAKAKLNLYLHVTGRRPDGYHELDTLFAFVEFGDVLTMETSGAFHLSQRGDCSDQLPDPVDNLIWKAAHLLADAYDRNASMAVDLDKRLPIASGLGGGSADAAAVLRRLCDLWNIPINEPVVQEIAIKLGADVPACVSSRAALATGVGDELQLVDIPTCGVLLVNPNVPLGTRAVFEAWSEGGVRFSQQNQPGRMDDFGAMIGALSERRNDLQPTAMSLQPVIGDVLYAIGQLAGCDLARMSGSGASCFGLFRSTADAKLAAIALREDKPDWWIQPTQLSGAGI